MINNYIPKKISDLNSTNKDTVNKVIKWILNFNNEKNNSILLIGNHGVGKKTLINIICNEVKYDLIKISNYNIKDYNFNDIINKKRILNNKNYLLLFDNIDNLTTSDKKLITILNNKNIKNKMFPIIYFSIIHNKYLSEIKKISDIYYINNPSNIELYVYIENIIIKQKYDIKDKNYIDNIIEYGLGDYRKINTILNIMINNNIEDFMNFFKVICKKDNHLDLYKATKELLYGDITYEEKIKIYNEDKVLLPLMVYQNLPNVLNNNFMKNIDDVINAYESISYSDLINTSMYINQNWELQEIYGHFSCVDSINKLNNVNKEKNRKIEYTIDLNKLSQKNVNKNTLRIILSKLNIEIEDIKYLYQILSTSNLNTKYKTYINKFK